VRFVLSAFGERINVVNDIASGAFDAAPMTNFWLRGLPRLKLGAGHASALYGTAAVLIGLFDRPDFLWVCLRICADLSHLTHSITGSPVRRSVRVERPVTIIPPLRFSAVLIRD
jgi:hypothetical protein